MELFITIAVLVILAETTYLVARPNKNKTALLASRAVGAHELILDTSILIDGRIIEIVRSGLVSSPIVVPSFVIDELQLMADKADHDKRERARYGLDVIQDLQRIAMEGQVIILDVPEHKPQVDSALVDLCVERGARLCTIDYNLNKVATVKSLQVVNINEIAHAIRSVHLPDEQFEVEIKQVGQNAQQGVGYLDDGTMVVVESARSFIGQRVTVKVQRALQTAAGRMVFAYMDKKDVKQATPQSKGKKNNSKQPRFGRNKQKSPEESVIDLIDSPQNVTK